MSVTPQSWCYLKVDVPNLDVISQELLTVLGDVFPDLTNLPPDYTHLWRKQIESKLPETTNFLREIKLLDRWTHLAFITGNLGTSLPIHVDGIDPIVKSYALNIPVLNCKHSYTVFYQAEIAGPIFQPDDIRKSSRYCNEDTAIEIARLESSEPAWINVAKPHKPVMEHNMPRAIASLRFQPEIHDYFTNTNE
jgi:hypothetical protein